jgi:putative ABC transport system permease protein
MELKVAPGYSLLAVAKFVERFLNRAHEDFADFRVSIPSELLRQRKRTQRVFNIVLGAVAGITLLVGGIGIMNIMLATVSQRVREIGIRRSIGASEEDILFQFLIESVTIAFIGGVLGIAFGVLLAHAIGSYAHWAVIINAKAVIVSVTVSMLVGVIFGFYPAEKASRLDPIEALRV